MVPRRINLTSGRILAYDLIRLFAMLGVIMIHSSAHYVINFPTDSFQFQVGNFLESISRLAIPCFIMLSGRFMLDEDRTEPPKRVGKKILSLIFILFSWSFFYALIYRSKAFWSSFFYGHLHMWYLYMTIGLYLITPILRLFVKRENKAYIYYFLVLVLTFKYIPAFLDIIFPTGDTISRFARLFFPNFGIGCEDLAMYLLGWLIKEDFEFLNKHSRLIIISTLGALLLVFFGTQIYTSPAFRAYSTFYSEKQLPVLLYGTLSFISIQIFSKNIEHKLCDKIKNFISLASRLTLGIYMVHMFILKSAISLLRYFFALTYNNCHPLLYIAAIYVPTIIISALITYILYNIKYLNKLVKI